MMKPVLVTIAFLSTLAQAGNDKKSKCTPEEEKKVAEHNESDLYKKCQAEDGPNPKATCAKKPSCVEWFKQFKTLPVCDELTHSLVQATGDKCIAEAAEAADSDSGASTSLVSAAIMLVSCFAYLI